MTVGMVLSFLGGLGMLLFGIRLMSDGLQAAAGERLRALLGKLTNNPIMGVLTGTVITAVIQSSSATTVMVVGLVNAGLLSLPQAIGVIMGANIGTSITAQLIAFNLGDFSLPAIGIGAMMYLFIKRRGIRNMGQSLLGFGILFLGLTIMSDTVIPLRELPAFQRVIVSMEGHNLYGILAGAGMTVALQSSSGTIGILQGLANQGVVSLSTALPVLIGDNIGTTVTAIIASAGTSITARRAAISHTLFNLVGAILFIFSLPYFAAIVQSLSSEPMRQLAHAHTLFNVSNALIQLPFIMVLAKVVRYLVPGEVTEIRHGPVYISSSLLSAPEVALQQVRRELHRMADIAKEILEDAMGAFAKNDLRLVEVALEKEQVVNELEKEITKYLVQLSRSSLNSAQSVEMNALLNFVNDIERVGDHAENIAELAEEKMEHGLPFSDQADSDVEEIYTAVAEALEGAMELLAEPENEALARATVEAEDRIDDLEALLRARHIDRLNRGMCYPESGVVFLDLLSNLERIGDHASSIAYITLDQISLRE
ncbi:MAG: Na/Pi cotransporter family protein [Clostridia bacterium]